jgi:peptide chain release factor 1
LVYLFVTSLEDVFATRFHSQLIHFINTLVVEEKDLKVDVYRASGPGGQGVNTTDSAVRITHLPSGLVVTCQDERSQIKNRAKALRVLRARLLEAAQEEQRSKIAAARKSQVGTGERSERIRTYNFPQGRVTDHRIGLTVHQLPAVLEGGIDELVEGLLAADRAEQLQALDV